MVGASSTLSNKSGDNINDHSHDVFLFPDLDVHFVHKILGPHSTLIFCLWATTTLPWLKHVLVVHASSVQKSSISPCEFVRRVESSRKRRIFCIWLPYSVSWILSFSLLLSSTPNPPFPWTSPVPPPQHLSSSGRLPPHEANTVDSLLRCLIPTLIARMVDGLRYSCIL